MKLIDIIRPHLGPPVNLDAIIENLPKVSMDNTVRLNDGISGQLKKLTPTTMS